MVPVTDVVSIPQAVIDASHAVPEVGWPCDRNPDCTGLDHDIIDRPVLQVLIIGHKSMNVGKEFEGIERSLPRGGRFPGSQRYGRECGVSVGGRYCCRCGIRCTCGFSAPIDLQQSKKEGVVFPNRPARIAAKLIDNVTGRFLETGTLIGQT